MSRVYQSINHDVNERFRREIGIGVKVKKSLQAHDLRFGRHTYYTGVVVSVGGDYAGAVRSVADLVENGSVAVGKVIAVDVIYVAVSVIVNAGRTGRFSGVCPHVSGKIRVGVVNARIYYSYNHAASLYAEVPRRFSIYLLEPPQVIVPLLTPASVRTVIRVVRGGMELYFIVGLSVFHMRTLFELRNCGSDRYAFRKRDFIGLIEGFFPGRHFLEGCLEDFLFGDIGFRFIVFTPEPVPAVRVFFQLIIFASLKFCDYGINGKNTFNRGGTYTGIFKHHARLRILLKLNQHFTRSVLRGVRFGMRVKQCREHQRQNYVDCLYLHLHKPFKEVRKKIIFVTQLLHSL